MDENVSLEPGEEITIDGISIDAPTDCPTGNYPFNYTLSISSYSFTTTEAGTHDLVYGLYKEDNLVVSGRLAFDVGDAVLMGIASDKFEYKDGNENVIVKIDYLGLSEVLGGVGTLSQKGSDPPEAGEYQESLSWFDSGSFTEFA
ncbi:MAG: hypothetical protein NT166_12115 [Candidatus Aminicenantes bacterium]|nr:hypothetical protein [Candidatus Aminicenantes bacterium]